MHTTHSANVSSANQNASQTKKRKVLVVGATGFLGAKIQRELEQDASLSVVAMSRKGAPPQVGSSTQWVRGDLLDPASLDAALKDIDVVVSSANGYMKESIDADFQGNRNLIEAAARAGVQRFVFLSIVACEAAPEVPHFHAKKVAEDLLKASGLAYVLVRAPAFLDQSADYVADAVKAGRFYVVGDKRTAWSYILTDDLAQSLVKAAAFPTDDIHFKTIDTGWRDGPKNQEQLAQLISQVTGKSLSRWVVPWFVLQVMVRLIKPFSELGYDLIQMMLFFKTGRFVSNLRLHERYIGPSPTAQEAITRWASENKLVP